MTVRRAVVYLLLLLGTGAAAYGIGGHSLRFLFGCCLVFVVYAAMAAFALSGRIHAELRLPRDRIYAGEDLEAEMTIRLPFSAPLAPFVWLAVEDRWVRSGAPAIVRRRLLLPAGTAGKGEARYRYRLSGLPRGVYRHAGSRIVLGDLFHAAVRSVRLSSKLAADRPVTVLPRPLGGDWLAGIGHAADAAGIGSVRDYRPGDPLRRLDWKSYARRRAWRTKEPDAEEARPPVLIIDDAEGDPQRFEGLIAAAARIVLAQPEGAGGLELRCGHRVLRTPAAGAAGKQAALVWLASLDGPRGVPLAQTLREALAQIEPHRTVIVAAASPDPALAPVAQRLGKAHGGLLAFVLAAPGARLAPEERKRLGLLAAAGWRVTMATEAAEARADAAPGGRKDRARKDGAGKAERRNDADQADKGQTGAAGSLPGTERVHG